MNTRYVIDTHPLIWYFQGKKTLSSTAKKLIQQGFLQEVTLVIPAIVFLEALHLSLKHSEFKFFEFNKTVTRQLVTAPLDQEVLSVCYTLPSQLEIHDRIIVATATICNCPIITKDDVITKSFPKKVVW